MAKSKTSKSNKTKSKNQKRSRPINFKQTLMVGLMLLAAIAFIFSSLPAGLFTSNNSKKSNSSTSTSATSSNSKSATAFNKEGSLTFQKAGGETFHTIDIEFSKTKAERDLGLMHRRFMPEDSGMLFYMDANEEQSFWMRNTYISLDIIYINEAKEIVSIAAQTTPLSETPIPSNAPAKYVLEVIAGYCAMHDIAVGDQVDWE